MSVGNPQAIGPSPAQPPKYGLLVAADTPTGDAIAANGAEQETPREWAQGVKWSPEQFHGGGVAALDCRGRTPDGFDFADNPAINTSDPFVVYAADQCSTFGFEGRDPWGRAMRQLLATQSFYIAREFQFGALAEHVKLEDAIELTGTTLSPVEALAALEGAISYRFAGARCMIHCTPQTFTFLAAANAIFAAGQKWLTALGSIVVADAGYTTEGDDEFMYATGLVKIRLGGIITLPSGPESRAEGTDRLVNDTEVIAQRLALIQVDGTEGADQDNPDAMFKVAVDIDPWSAS